MEGTGFVQAAQLDSRGFARHTLTVPGTRPIQGYDLAAGIDYRKPLDKTLYIRRGDCVKTGVFPERFIQRLEGPGVPTLEFTIGYLTDAGIGVPGERTKNTDTGLFLYHRTGKIHPWAINTRNFRPGETVHCRTFRQYRSAE